MHVLGAFAALALSSALPVAGAFAQTVSAATAADVMAMASEAIASPRQRGVAAARHEFLDALSARTRDADALAGLLPRRGAGTVADLMAGDVRDADTLARHLGLDPQRFVAAGGPFIAAGTQVSVTAASPAEVAAAMAVIPAFLPVKTIRESSDFGYRADPINHRGAMHMGVDMMGSKGEPIYAAANGVVARAGGMSGYGNLIELRHAKGVDTRYGHLSRILVKAGESVRQGQIIGLMGSTGRSTGTHLHYEVRIDGNAVNPEPFLAAAGFVLAAQHKASAFGPPALHQAIVPVLGSLMADDRVTAGGR